MSSRRAWLRAALWCALTLVVYGVYSELLSWLTSSPSIAWGALCGVGVACALASKVHCRDLPDAPRLLVRGLAIACGVYNLLLFPDFPVISQQPGAHAHAYILAAWCAAAAAAVLTWQRPAWLLFCAFYAFWIRQVAGWVTGFPFHTMLEVQPLYQMPAYLAMAVVVHRLLVRQQTDAHRTWLLMLCIGVALHAANYAVAGVAKVTLDGTFLQWPLHNDTVNILLVALHHKQLLWGDISVLVDPVVRGFEAVQRPIAIVLLGCQLAMLAAFANKRLMLTLLVFFDLMHIGIFLIAGGNFWSWFMVNLAIIVAVNRVPAAAFNRTSGLVGAVLIVCAPALIKVSPLAWYDTRAVNAVYFEVVDDAGQKTRVPNTFFGFYSYPLAHRSFGLPPGPVVPTSTNGGTIVAAVAAQAEQCRFRSTESPIKRRWDHDALQQFIRAYHLHVKTQAPPDGHVSKAWYPHHFWSAPSLERAFSKVDLRRIVRYNLIVESVCLDPTGAVARALYRNEATFDVR